MRLIKGGANDKQSQAQQFEALYRESYSRVYNYVRYRMGNSADAEDVVSEAYLLAARSFDKFDPTRARFSTWVTKIAINCMVGHWRRERQTTTLDAVPEGLLATSDETDAFADRELLDQLLAQLSSEEVDLVYMKYHEGMRNVDIAAELGMNPSTVATKLFNAIHKMRAVAGRE